MEVNKNKSRGEYKVDAVIMMEEPVGCMDLEPSCTGSRLIEDQLGRSRKRHYYYVCEVGLRVRSLRQTTLSFGRRDPEDTINNGEIQNTRGDTLMTDATEGQ